MQSALVASLKNKRVARRTLWIKTDLLEDIVGGIRDSFGDDFELIKVIVETQDIETANITLTKINGTVVELKNKFLFENPTVTVDANSDEVEMPFLEVEIKQKLKVNLS